MGTGHVSFEDLSALLDSELEPTADVQARQHLADCAACSAEYAMAVRLDEELRRPPAFTCEEVHDLVSASFDRQTNEAEEAAVQRHLATCETCPALFPQFEAITASVRALPRLAPSARVDTALRDLVAPRRSRRVAPVTGLAARGLLVATAIFAIVVAGLGLIPPRQAALVPGTTDRVLVAAMQQIVFNPRNNTLYVLDVATAAVDAREPETNELRARIPVGGEPTALALNENANTVLVLDAAQKRVTEIDASSNTVIGATTVAVAGTPTSISVDPATNRILVSTVATPSSQAAQTPAGAVAVINGSTKQLETVREMDLAPRLVVPDPRRSRTALVSADATRIVDSSYAVLETLPGGVSAAFSRRGDVIAVLSGTPAGAVITFAGPGAPEPLKLQGVPSAMTALPDGGYLVLVDAGGRGRVTRVSTNGTVVASVEVAVTGGDLVYDEAANRFTVARAGRFDTAEMPTQAAVVTSTPTESPTAVAASPTASASPTTSATVAVVQAPVAATAPGASPTVNLLGDTLAIGPNLYTLRLPSGVKPTIATMSGSRLWFIDQSSGVYSFDTGTGELSTFGKLRGARQIGFWVASPSYAYAMDAAGGEINVVDIKRQRIDAFATNLLRPVAAVAAGRDDRLWIALRDASDLFVFDPRTRVMNSIDLGTTRISALTVDQQGRVLYADDHSGTVGVLDTARQHLDEVGFAKRGSTTSLLVDANSTLWLGTSTGEIYAIRGRAARLAVSVQRPVTSLALDHTGRAWYLAPLPSGLSGYIYAPADNSQEPRSVSGPAISLGFNPLGRALLADPRGGIYMSTEGAR